MMTWQAWSATVGVALSFVAMASGRASAEASFGVVLAAMLVLGIVTPAQALVGFSNEQLHTIALLFVIAGTLQNAGSLELATSRLFIQTRSALHAVARLVLPVVALSSVLNNTAVVAMLIPQVRAWAQKTGVSPSRFLIPLSYAAILGGLLTIVGTSTNLVVNGLVHDAGKQTIGFLEIGKIGLPVAIAGILALIPTALWLLPDRPELTKVFADAHTFVSEAVVEANSKYVGKALSSIRPADAPSQLPVEIIRAGEVSTAPPPEFILKAGDRLVFTGPATIMMGLRQDADLHFEETTQHQTATGKRVFVELVLAARCPVLGAAVGSGSFRKRYRAAIVAVARHGSRVTSRRWDDWLLRVGDVVLVEAGADFLEAHQNSSDFYVVTSRAEIRPGPKRDAWRGLVVLVAMVGCVAMGWLTMLTAALLTVAVLWCFRLIDSTALSNALSLRVLVAIALALGLGKTLEVTGAAASMAAALVRAGGEDPWLSFALIYIGTTTLSEAITNNAAAAIAVPLALATAERLSVSHLPFTVAVMVAASASFATPMGYQTNLMVYGPGNYRFSDFLKAGLLMNLVVAGVSLKLIPRIWPF